jgi:4-alpha-glucanotransferase
VSDDAVRELARAAGIAVEWTDAAGAPHRVAADVLRSILDALGLPCGNAVDLAESRERLVVGPDKYCPPALVTAEAGKPVMLPEHIRGPAQLALEGDSRIDVALERRQNGWLLGPIAQPGYHVPMFANRVGGLLCKDWAVGQVESGFA